MNRRTKCSLCLVASGLLIFSLSSRVLACGGEEPYLGSVCFSVTNYCPEGYLEANGQQLAINDYQALYTLLGTTYGGTTTAFNLPDLRGRVPVGQGIGPGLTPAVQGKSSGAESAKLVESNLPPHNHAATFTAGSSSTLSLNATTTTATSAIPTSTANQLGSSTGPSVKIYAPGGGTQVPLAGIGGAVVTVQPAGAGSTAAVPVITPQSVLRACIVVRGIYPPQP
ncbi:phage tail protein [Kosakonia cowanii]|jgi:microcystin-dependent protein|uniref:phage tail protein n=1 Tax=Kosakonia cowanii TaxID=208223 RepID=UPI001F57871A|nr:tail fiber protein [Kosakonia cowanii]MDT3409757.1 microcystin-dependent protein [Atlantibacter sp. SORGH_AS_0304]